MRYNHGYISDRLRPGLPTNALGVAQQGTCGNYDTLNTVKTREEREEEGE